jgi:phage terminase large subunit GpA-like protein
MKIQRKTSNIFERKFFGGLLMLLERPIRISIIEWAEKYRILTSEESHFIGKFDCSRIPALEYVYDCLDNKFIYIIVVMKGSQIGWSELTNNFLGKKIHTDPDKIQWAFANREASKLYSREKLKPFFDNTKVLKDIINQTVAKESFNYFKFPGGFLKLTTLGSISNMKTSSIPCIGVEEPDDVKDDVKGQGNTLDLLKGRQKSFPIGFKKLIYGGTPTDKDFSRVEKGYNQSNRLVFKAECHHCKELVELDIGMMLKYDEYQDRYIDEMYGKHNPETARLECPFCLGIWSDEDKEQNILNGKQHGFYDFTGKFSKGWHPKKPEITESFGFHIPELLSTLSSSTVVELAKKKILADIEIAKGDEGLMKSFVNNTSGLPYASGITSLEVEEMKKFRKNYPENVCPMDGLELTCGIDVQDNRFAIIIRAWGRNNNSWLVSWFEIFGDVKVQNLNEEGNGFTGIWGELTDKTVKALIPHAGGKLMPVSAVSIDSGDNTELVYKWVKVMNELDYDQVRATKGAKDLGYSEDPIYREPALADLTSEKQVRATVAETTGITLFRLGAHAAHAEILSRIMLNTKPDARSNIYYHNEQSYGQYEEQILSCRKIVEAGRSIKSVFKLIPGKRKEAIDAEKNALHANYAYGIRNFTHSHWSALEAHYYEIKS